MKHRNMLSVAAVCMLTLPLAQAQSNAQNTVWADVVEAEPVIRIVRQPVNERTCWQEEVYEAVPERRSNGKVFLGAVLGGVIGHQFGGGSGRDAMGLVGAAIGSSIAAERQRERNPQRYYAALEDRCAVNTEWRETRQIIGWDVVYEYQGQTYVARMPEEPGERIEIEVEVRPVQ